MKTNITIDTNSQTFRHSFIGSLLLLAIVCFTAVAYSWDGPISSPPNSNTPAPVNVGTDSQVKSGPLSVDGLSVYGSQYIEGNLGIGGTPGSNWRIEARGSTHGIYAEATSGQAIRGNNTGSGWAGYFTGRTYTSSYNRADGGFCIGGSCMSAWRANGPLWNGPLYGVQQDQYYTTDCPTGYVMTGLGVWSGWNVKGVRIRCRRLAN